MLVCGLSSNPHTNYFFGQGILMLDLKITLQNIDYIFKKIQTWRLDVMILVYFEFINQVESIIVICRVFQHTRVSYGSGIQWKSVSSRHHPSCMVCTNSLCVCVCVCVCVCFPLQLWDVAEVSIIHKMILAIL
jgi:hypothetical protein